MSDLKDTPFRDLAGATIASVEVIPAEFGRTYQSYVLVTTTDGRRAVLNSASGSRDAGKGVYQGGNVFASACPDVDEMRRAPKFFGADDIADRVRLNELKVRKQREDERERKQRELERLQRELAS